jgi:hypothetical protein
MPRLRRASQATYREDAHIVQATGRILTTLAVRHPAVLSLQMATRMIADAEADLERRAAAAIPVQPAARR